MIKVIEKIKSFFSEFIKNQLKPERRSYFVLNNAKLWSGIRISASGFSDYEIKFKVIKGKVNLKKINKISNDSDNWKIFSATPITSVAKILITGTFLSANPNNHDRITIKLVKNKLSWKNNEEFGVDFFFYGDST